MPSQATAAPARGTRKTSSRRTPRDAYETTTAAVLAALEQGTIPWRKPWSGTQGVPAKNVASGRAYRGVNFLVLAAAGYESPWWLTFKQAKDKGAAVRKGEKGTGVVFWKALTIRDPATVAAAREAGEPVRRDERGEYVDRLMSRVYSVFNAAQVDGLEDFQADPATTDARWEPIATCEEIARGYTPGPDVREGGPQAFYDLTADRVTMPDRGRFADAGDWHATLFHELAHSTGHPSRLNRPDLTGGHRFGTKGYAREELTAELAAAMLCTVAGIDLPVLDRQAAYIEHWRQAIGQDVQLVMTAAQRAQKAADRILGLDQDGGRA